MKKEEDIKKDEDEPIGIIGHLGAYFIMGMLMYKFFFTV